MREAVNVLSADSKPREPLAFWKLAEKQTAALPPFRSLDEDYERRVIAASPRTISENNRLLLASPKQDRKFKSIMNNYAKKSDEETFRNFVRFASSLPEILTYYSTRAMMGSFTGRSDYNLFGIPNRGIGQPVNLVLGAASTLIMLPVSIVGSAVTEALNFTAWMYEGKKSPTSAILKTLLTPVSFTAGAAAGLVLGVLRWSKGIVRL